MSIINTNLQTTTGASISHPTIAIVQPPRSLPKWDNRALPDYDEAFNNILDLISPDIRPKDVKVSKNRMQYDTITGYLEEIEPITLARACALCEQIMDCTPYGSILRGDAWKWLRLAIRSYPVLIFARDMAQSVREGRFAEATLAKLEVFAGDSDPKTRASAVKSCEILLRTYDSRHKKDSAQVAEAVNLRPIVTINMANFYSPQNVPNASPNTPKLGEIVDSQ